MALKENNLARCYIKGADWVARDIAGETIIVPIRNSVGDLDSIYTLNGLGTLIWQSIDGRTSVGQIVESISRGYDVTPEEASNDTSEFLDSLEEAGLIHVRPDGPDRKE